MDVLVIFTPCTTLHFEVEWDGVGMTEVLL